MKGEVKHVHKTQIFGIRISQTSLIQKYDCCGIGRKKNMFDKQNAVGAKII